MVVIAGNHRLDIVQGILLESGPADILPAGDFLKHQKTDLVAAIQKMFGLHIVRRPDDICAKLALQYLGVSLLNAFRHGVPAYG